jgi:F-type H+-transporting ATPase subunit epsilon
MSSKPKLHITVVTAEKRVYDGVADDINAPGADGRLGILPRHAPLVGALTIGELRVRNGGDLESIYIGGGFIEVSNNVVTILADDAERAADVDEDLAELARQRAQAVLQGKDISSEGAAVAAAEMRRAIGRLHVAEMHRKRGGRRRTLQQIEQES